MSTGTIGRVMGYLFLAVLVLVIGIVAWAFYLNWDLKRWDARIDALCTANGGRDVEAKIYETVKAPETTYYFSNPPDSFFGYQRSGDGMPGIDIDEIRVCPTITSEKRLDVQVFTNHPRHMSGSK